MQSYIEVASNGAILRGFLHRPERVEGRIPMVILFHGFSNNKTEHYFSFVEVSRHLEQIGIASMRLDFMGSGDSDGRYQEMSVETEIADGMAMLQYAKGLEYIDSDRIALVGMSFGGLVASVLAGRAPSDIRALCLWAPAVIAIRDAREGRVGGSDVTAALAADGVAEVGGLLVGKRLLEDSKNLHFQSEVAPYKNRVCLIWGRQDPIVPPDIVEEISLAYGDRLEKHGIEGIGHMFETYAARITKLNETIAFLKRELLDG